MTNIKKTIKPATRREVVAGLAATMAIPALGSAAAAEPLGELVLYGPPAGPSITLAHAVATGALSAIANKVSFKAWRNPDELRAGLTSGTMKAVVMPTTAAANLYGRGFGLKLVNVMTKGLLYVVTTDETITDFKSLKGKKFAVPFHRDTPDILLNRLLVHHGIDVKSDIEIQYTGTPVEAIQLLITGRADAALVPEPAATAVMIKAGQMGKKVVRAIDIQKAWGELTGLGSVVPQAGLAVTSKFLGDNPEIVTALQEALVSATADVIANPGAAAKNAAAALSFPQPIIAKSIATSNLTAMTSSQARPALEAMYQAILESDPDKIGGKLPGDTFYM